MFVPHCSKKMFAAAAQLASSNKRIEPHSLFAILIGSNYVKENRLLFKKTFQILSKSD